MNNITITGNTVDKPELRFTPSGKAVAQFRLASSQGKDKEALFIPVECWDDVAKNVAELDKGVRVQVSGFLKMDHWQDKEGAKRQTFKISAQDVAVSCRWQTVSVSKQASKITDEEVPF